MVAPVSAEMAARRTAAAAAVADFRRAVYEKQTTTGAASAEVAWRVVAEHGPENVVLLTADTLVEDADNWRFAQRCPSPSICGLFHVTEKPRADQ